MDKNWEWEAYLALLVEVECLFADDFARDGAVAILDIVESRKDDEG